MTDWQPSSRSCFLCGRDNPVGLGVRWANHPETREIRGSVTVAEHFNGFPGVLHGGIVAALLDETAGRTVLLEGGFDDLMVTLKLEVSYRKPTPTETPLTLVGRLVAHSETRAQAEAKILLADGTVTAQAKAILARPPQDIAERWSGERGHWRVDVG